MTRHRMPVMTPFELSLRLWEASWTSAEMMAGAGMTIGLRSLAMGEAALGLRPHDAAENARMVTEKMEAAQEAALAMLRATPFVAATAGGTAEGLARALRANLKTYGAILAPYHRRTTANAKRLGRKTR